MTNPDRSRHERAHLMGDKVKGYCPLGCGETLFLGMGGHVTCSKIYCPRPDAVSTLLEDRETEHIVELWQASFSMKHPLRERLDDELLTCALGKHISGLDGPPLRLGRYRVFRQAGAWTWEMA